MTRSLRWSLLVLATMLLGAGCTLGPEPERPATAADGAAGYVGATSTTAVAAAAEPPVSPWWTTFGDQATAELVDLALAHNTDLAAAAARVLEAEASLERAGGARWPQVSAGLSASRQKSSFVLPGVGRTGIYSTTYADDLSVSYVVDLFGKLRRTRQAAWASLLAEEAAAEAVTHAVVAAVVRARVQVATLERGLAIARDLRASWQRTLDTVERRYRSGLVTAVDLYLARENLSSVQASEARLEGGVRQARHALDVLVGRRPGAGETLPNSLPELPELAPVPLGLPAELLDRRPDLRQAESRLVAATYGVGAAIADLYPSLTLTGAAGMRSDTLSDLTSTDGLIYNAVGSLLAPLFTGGQRRAEVKASRARVDQAAAAYAGAVLTALREVEDALVASASTVESLRFTERRLDEARAADRLARERYQRGVESLLRVLETERRLRAAEEALLATKADLWNARVDLHLALGGNWRKVPDEAADPDGARVASAPTAAVAPSVAATPHALPTGSRSAVPTSEVSS